GREAERFASAAAEPALAAGTHQVRHDPITYLPPLDTLAERGDPADDLDPEDERELDREARDTLAHVDVEVVQRARGDVDADLAWTRFRIGDVLQLQDVEATELVEHHRFHASTSERRTTGRVYV